MPIDTVSRVHTLHFLTLKWWLISCFPPYDAVFQLSSVLDILPCFVLLSILLCILGCVVLFLVYIRSTDKIIHPILRVTYLTTLLSCRVTTSPHWLHRLMAYAYSFTDHFIISFPPFVLLVHNHRLKQIANIVAHRRHIVKK